MLHLPGVPLRLPRPRSHRSSVLWILYPLPPHNHEAHDHIDHHHPPRCPHRNPHPPPPRWPWDLSHYQGLLSPRLSKPFRCQLKKLWQQCLHGSWLKFWNLQGVIGGERYFLEIWKFADLYGTQPEPVKSHIDLDNSLQNFWMLKSNKHTKPKLRLRLWALLQENVPHPWDFFPNLVPNPHHPWTLLSVWR